MLWGRVVIKEGCMRVLQGIARIDGASARVGEVNERVME